MSECEEETRGRIRSREGREECKEEQDDHRYLRCDTSIESTSEVKEMMGQQSDDGTAQLNDDDYEAIDDWNNEEELDPIQKEFLRRMQLSIEGKSAREAAANEEPVASSSYAYSHFRSDFYSSPFSFPNSSTVPFTCRVSLIKTEENEKLLEHAAVEPLLSWSAALSNLELRENISRMFPVMLPLQKTAIPVIKNTAFDCVFNCPSGLGRTTSWMLPTIDHLLGKGRRTYPDQIHFIVLCSSEDKAEDLREEMYVYIPLHRDKGCPLYAVDVMRKDNIGDIELKVKNVGIKVLITTPQALAKANFLPTASIRMMIVDRYEDLARIGPDAWIAIDEIYGKLDTDKKTMMKTTIMTSIEVDGFPFRDQLLPVVHGEVSLPEYDDPRLQFLYVRSDEAAYVRLKQTLDVKRYGTCIILVNGYTERLWEELPYQLPHLKFGFLTHKTQPYDRVQFLRDYKNGKFDVVVASYRAEKYLECVHRVLDLYYVIPEDDLYNFKRLLNRRCRISRGDSITFLDCSDLWVMHAMEDCAERAGQDPREVEQLRLRMEKDLEEKRERKERERREEERQWDLKQQREERGSYSHRDNRRYQEDYGN